MLPEVLGFAADRAASREELRRLMVLASRSEGDVTLRLNSEGVAIAASDVMEALTVSDLVDESAKQASLLPFEEAEDT